MKKDNNNLSDNTAQAVTSKDVYIIKTDSTIDRKPDSIAVEQVVTVMIDKVGSFTILCSPSDLKALAVGFVFAEGMIDSTDDILDITLKQDMPNVVGVQIHDPSRITIERNMIVASSCGMCGSRNIEKLLNDVPQVENSLKLSAKQLMKITENMLSRQKIFHNTGGSHAACIFDAEGRITSFAEDIGRHNALDKAVGKCLLNGISMKSSGAALSGRASLEMVSKAARAGLELIAAVSAPSSLAVETAQKWNITLCGFVRPERLNVYTHRERIKDSDTEGNQT